MPEPVLPIDIKPVTVKNLPAFLAAVTPFAGELLSGQTDAWGLLCRHTDALIAATALGCDVDRSWLDQQTPEVLVDLAAQVIEVNADFFARVLAPGIARAAERIASLGTNLNPGGTTG